MRGNRGPARAPPEATEDEEFGLRDEEDGRGEEGEEVELVPLTAVDAAPADRRGAEERAATAAARAAAEEREAAAHDQPCRVLKVAVGLFFGVLAAIIVRARNLHFVFLVVSRSSRSSPTHAPLLTSPATRPLDALVRSLTRRFCSRAGPT